MDRKIIIILLVSILLVLPCGCSVSGDTSLVTPSDEPADVHRESSIHHTWGLWQFIADPVNHELDVVQLRAGDQHLNALKFLEPPVNVYLTAENIQFNGNIIELNLGLRHPFLGITQFTGFDVCGVLITNGSVSGFDDPDLVMAGDGDTRLLNPDGYTRWWNPAEFPVNNGSMFCYQDGLLGAPNSAAEFNCTLNAYKYFCDDLDADDDYISADPNNRGMFSTGQKNVRHYIIELGAGLVFNYAIDANWKFPLGQPPWEAPDDFPPGANRAEAWGISITETENCLYNDGAGDSGGDLKLLIDVFDHFNAEQNIIKVESPGNFAPAFSNGPIGGGSGYKRFEVEITYATPGEGSVDLLITVTSEKVGYQGMLPGIPQASYFVHTSPVSDTPPVYDKGWRQFRHDMARTGRSSVPGPVTNNILYKFEVESATSVEIFGGIVFDSQDRALFRCNNESIYCVNPNGEVAWDTYIQGDYDYCTPFIDDEDGVYVGSTKSWLYHFNSDGDYQWHKAYAGGTTYYPTVQEDGTILFCRGSGKLEKTDSSGNVIWTYNSQDVTLDGPAVGEDGMIYMINFAGELHAVNQDGGMEWHVVCGEDKIYAAPALGPLGIYVADLGGYVYCVNYEGSFEWVEQIAPAGIKSCIAIGNDGYIYTGTLDRRLYCLDAADGSVEWSYLTGGTITSMAPILDGFGHVYVGSDCGHFYCLTTDGDLVWELDCQLSGTNAMWCRSPALSDNGILAFGTNAGVLFAIQDE